MQSLPVSDLSSSEVVDLLRSRSSIEDAAIHALAAGGILRAAGLPDGTIDPGRLASWRLNHAEALSALPDLDAHLGDAGHASEIIAEIIRKRRAAGVAAQKAALARAVGMGKPEDVSAMLGGVLSGQDVAGRMKAIRDAVGRDRAARQGLRRVTIEALIARAAGGGEAGECVKSDAFVGFVRQNEAAICEAGFAPGEVRVLDAIFAAVDRAGRLTPKGRQPNASVAARSSGDGFGGETPFSAIVSVLSGACAAGPPEGMEGGAMALVRAMCCAGLRTADDLASDAMASPERARLLLSQVKPAEEAARVRDLVASYARAALEALSAEEKHRDDDPEFSDDQPDPLQILAFSGLGKRPPANVRSASDGALSNVRKTIARDREVRQALRDARDQRLAHMKP